MLKLKRLYDHDAPAERWGAIAQECRDCNGRRRVIAANDDVVDCPTCGGNGHVDRRVPPVRGVAIQVASGPVHHFSERFIHGGVAEGWLAFADGRVTIRNDVGDDAVYRITRGPGWYCCHCDAQLANSKEGALHVARTHRGAASPDPNNPSGWCRINHYVGVKE